MDTFEHLCEVCSNSDIPVQLMSSTKLISIYHIDTIADPAQLTNLFESELTEIAQRMHISKVFETEEDDNALVIYDITDFFSRCPRGANGRHPRLNPDDNHP